MATRFGASLVDASITTGGLYIEVATILCNQMIALSIGGYMQTGAIIPTTPLILVVSWNRYAGGAFNESYNISNIQAANTITPLNNIPIPATSCYSCKIAYTQPTGQPVTLKLAWGGLEP